MYNSIYKVPTLEWEGAVYKKWTVNWKHRLYRDLLTLKNAGR